MTVYNDSFYGHKISEYGLQNGYIDYATLAKSFDAVLNNDIISKTQEIGYWECVNGTEYDEESENYYDIFQYYIISQSGFETLQRLTDEIVFYNEELDMYVWGVTHYGTSWDYVLTDIAIKRAN
jgi:hypothetical protein